MDGMMSLDPKLNPDQKSEEIFKIGNPINSYVVSFLNTFSCTIQEVGDTSYPPVFLESMVK